MRSPLNQSFAVKGKTQKKFELTKDVSFRATLVLFAVRRGFRFIPPSETKSALAERNIRSPKLLIFKYMHEHDQSRFCDKLDQFVAIINNRVN